MESEYAMVNERLSAEQAMLCQREQELAEIRQSHNHCDQELEREVAKVTGALIAVRLRKSVLNLSSILMSVLIIWSMTMVILELLELL